MPVSAKGMRSSCKRACVRAEEEGRGLTLRGRLLQMSAAALRTRPVDDSPPETKASVDTKHAAARTAAASSMNIELHIFVSQSRPLPSSE